MRVRSLRARLTLLVAVAVAVAIAVAATGCWFMVSEQLYDELDRDLSERPWRARLVAALNADCRRNPNADDEREYLFLVQLVRGDGTRCATGSVAFAVAPSDIEVARSGGSALRDGVTDQGASVRVYTRNVGDGLAFSVARQTDEINQTPRDLAWLFAFAAAGGVLLAASAGLAIARAALAPIDALTERVSAIARTEDLSMHVPAGSAKEVTRLSTAFNAMTAALASSRDRQRRLVADAGHELRTPLTSLQANIELLLRSEDSGRSLSAVSRRDLLSDLREQVTELAALAADLLDLARPARPAAGAPQEAARLHSIVEEAVRRTQLRGTACLSVSTTPWHVHGEADSLERAVVNLLDNAVKFSPDGSTISVRLVDGTLTIRDHGPGVPEEDLPFVFDRFWRSTSARGVPGSGLGLAIAAQVVRDLGGEIELTSPADGGTEVVVRLPGTSTNRAG